MKKLISLLLCIILIISAVPLTALESAAATRIYLDREYSVRCSSVGTWDVKTFVPDEDGIYIFSSSGSLDTLGYIALAEGEAENENIKADGGQGNNFAVTYDMKAGTTYYLGSTVLTGSTGTYTVKIIKFEVDDDTIHPISLSDSTSVSTSKSKNIKFFSLAPATSGKYIFLSSGNYDTLGYVFDEYWRQIAYSDDGGSGSNFQIELDLQAGKTYYLGYATTSVTTASFNVLAYMSTYIRGISLVSAPDKTVYIKDIDAKPVADNMYNVNLSLRGFVFKVNYANSSTEEKKYTYGIRGLDCEQSRNLVSGENDVRFSYMGNSSTFKVYVNETPVQSLTLLQNPDKSVYYEEDAETALNETKIFNISLYGMLIRVTYKDGTQENLAISSAYGEEIDYFYFEHVVPQADMTLGNNTFTLTYYGKELEFTVKYSLNSDNWQYDVTDGKVTLTKYIGTEAQAVIPDELGGYPVTAIGESCFKDNTSLKSVRMSEGITAIGDNAFYGCSALTELTLPKNLTSLGYQACFGLTGLEKLNWNCENLSVTKANNSFAYMGNNTDSGTTVEFGFDCTAIPADAFNNSSTSYSPKISTIIVGENVSSIGNNAFRDLAYLSRVEWNALNITSTLGAVNNIWLNSASGSSFEVYIGEYVQSLPNMLFYAANATRAPRISKITAESKDTTVAANTFKANSAVALTYYCHYNPDTSVNSVYKLCKDNSYNYVLLDSPVSRIYIHSQLEKDEYIVGEELDLTGLVVRAVFEDGTELDVTDEIEISGFDSTTAGVQNLTFSYTFIDKTVSANYEVLVSEEPLVLDSIYIKTLPDKRVFYYGDIFDSSGICVIAKYTNGLEQDVSAYVRFSGYNMSRLGTQFVSVSFTYEQISRSTTYQITVKEVALESVAILTLPDKTDYVAGEEFNPDGIKVIAEYNSGSTADISSLCEFSGYDMNTVGAQQVTVGYTESGVYKSDCFNITVHNLLTGITIDALPSVTSFIEGSEFSANNIKVSASYENGDTADVSGSVSFSGYDMSSAGIQTVTVTYTEGNISKTAEYQITVREITLTLLQLSTAPTAVQYQNEALNTEGLVIYATYSNGKRENVADKVTLSGYNMSVLGEQSVTASYVYNGKRLSVNFTINVVKKAESELQRCDVNGDGVVDISDISEILLTGNYALAADKALNARADVDLNGTVTVADISVLLRENNYSKSVV